LFIRGIEMSEECKKCEHSGDLKGCAAKHASTVRRLLSEGKIEEAEKNLTGFEKHLEKS
jgi:hypothetical protein